MQDAPQAAHAAWDVKGTPRDVASLPGFATPGPSPAAAARPDPPRRIIWRRSDHGDAMAAPSEPCGHFAGMLADPRQLRREIQFDDGEMHEPASAPDRRRKLLCVLAQQQDPEAHEQDLEIQPN